MFIESERALNILSVALKERHNPKLKETLTLSIMKVRSYQVAHRKGGFDYLESMPCGHQDAFGDRIEAMFRAFEALKIAYELQGGKGRRFYKYCKLAVGEQ